MKKKVALVTGGTRGIGAAISILLKKQGYSVIANYRSNDDEAMKFNYETNIPIYKWDVTDFQECKNNIEKIEHNFKSSIAILINNAGIAMDCMFHKMPYESWHKVIDCNLNSCYNMCANIYPKMREELFGRIINISSINALSGQIGQTNYAASKAALIGFSKSLAQEAAPKNITVNVVAPGYIKTDMLDMLDSSILETIINKIPMKRLGMPNEVASLVAFLASEESSFITGTTFSINGGQRMD